MQPGTDMNWSKVMTETPELAEECLQTNHYGAKRMSESLIPFLQLSDSPRIINVSSTGGKLEVIIFAGTHIMIKFSLLFSFQ